MEQVFCVNALIFFHFFLFFIFQSEAINANRTKKKMWKPLFYHHFDFFNLTLSNLLLLKKNRVKRRVLAFASINVLYVSWNPPNNLKFISLSFARWFFSYKFFIGFSEPISWFQFKSFPKQPYTSSHFSLRIISLLFFFSFVETQMYMSSKDCKGQHLLRLSDNVFLFLLISIRFLSLSSLWNK